MQADILIRNAMIIDGTEKDRYKGNVFIKDGAITAITSTETMDADLEAKAKEVIDANWNIVCPGFIDSHTHSDLMLLWDRQHAAGLCQGITTEILGQDGLSYAPLSSDNLQMYVKFLSKAERLSRHCARLVLGTGLQDEVRPDGRDQYRLSGSAWRAQAGDGRDAGCAADRQRLGPGSSDPRAGLEGRGGRFLHGTQLLSLLVRFCREYGYRLETMINRMCKVPADRFGLKDRGRLAVGYAADVVIFDKDRVTDTATYQLSRSAPIGISHVLVNGRVAVRNEKVTAVFAGRALSRG